MLAPAPSVGEAADVAHYRLPWRRQGTGHHKNCPRRVDPLNDLTSSSVPLASAANTGVPFRSRPKLGGIRRKLSRYAPSKVETRSAGYQVARRWYRCGAIGHPAATPARAWVAGVENAAASNLTTAPCRWTTDRAVQLKCEIRCAWVSTMPSSVGSTSHTYRRRLGSRKIPPTTLSR